MMSWKKGKLESRGKRHPSLFIANCFSDLLCDLEKSTNNSKPPFTCLWSKYKVTVTSCFQGPWVWVGSSHVTRMHVSWAWLSLYGTKRHALCHKASVVANTTQAAPGCRRSREASFLLPTHQVCNSIRSKASVRGLKPAEQLAPSCEEIRTAANPQIRRSGWDSLAINVLHRRPTIAEKLRNSPSWNILMEKYPLNLLLFHKYCQKYVETLYV